MAEIQCKHADVIAMRRGGEGTVRRRANRVHVKRLETRAIQFPQLSPSERPPTRRPPRWTCSAPAQAPSPTPPAARLHPPHPLEMSAITPEQITAGLAALDADLAWVLEDTGISRELRGKVGHMGIRRLNTFAKLEADEGRFRDALRNLFGLNPDEDPASRVQQALMVDAWDRARDRLRAQSAIDAEAAAEGRAKPMPRGQQINLRKTYEAAFGELRDDAYPSKDYLLELLDCIEENEYAPEELTSVSSWEQARCKPADDLALMIGTVKVRGTSKKFTVPAPRNTDELRKTYRLLWTAWTVVRMKHPDRPELRDLGRATWEEVLDYLLGHRCWEKVTPSGTRISWTDLLAYEYQIRKYAAQYVNRGRGTMVEGLRAAVKDSELRNEYFVEQLATTRSRRSRTPRRPGSGGNGGGGGNGGSGGGNRGGGGKGGTAWGHGGNDGRPGSSNDGNNRNKGKKGGKKGGGRGSNGGAGEGDEAETAEQQARAATNNARKREKLKFVVEAGGKKQTVCIKYNRMEDCGANCRYAHVCLRCGASHRLYVCPVAPVMK